MSILMGFIIGIVALLLHFSDIDNENNQINNQYYPYI